VRLAKSRGGLESEGGYALKSVAVETCSAAVVGSAPRDPASHVSTLLFARPASAFLRFLELQPFSGFASSFDVHARIARERVPTTAGARPDRESGCLPLCDGGAADFFKELDDRGVILIPIACRRCR